MQPEAMEEIYPDDCPLVLVVCQDMGAAGGLVSCLNEGAKYLAADYSAGTLRKIVKHPVSVIIFDVDDNLEIVGEFVEWILAEEATRRIPIVLLTKDSEQTKAALGENSSKHVDLVVKPYDEQTLGNKINMLGQLYSDYRGARDASLAKSEFLSTASHGIRTPLSGMIGITELLLQSELSQDQHHRIQTLLFGGETLLQILNDILDISMIEKNQMELDSVAFDFKRLCEEVADVLAIRAFEKHLDFIVRYPENTPRYVVGDPHRIKQILYNLIGNSIKFTDRGYVELKVIAYEESDALSFEVMVTDTGIGIEDHMKASIFETGVQGEVRGRQAFVGTGLGLPITRKLAECMGGGVTFTSTRGRGSTFTVTLKMHADEAYEAEREFVSKEKLLGIKVLILDDSKLYTDYCVEVLQNYTEQVDSANSGEDALNKLEAAAEAGEGYDLVLVDYMMPSMNGREVAKVIKSTETVKDTMLILVTAYPRKGEEVVLQAEGFSGYISKPFREEALASVLNSVQKKRSIEGGGTGNGTFIEPEDIPRKTIKGAANYDGIRVLIVDDNETNRCVAEMALEETGCEVVMAEDGQQALRVLEGQEFQLVFMDCNMPVMDGYEASRLIKHRMKLGDFHSCPIIAFTANVKKEEISKCARAGMNDYILKPFREDDLKTMLAKWL